jgi:hypothetical protein
LSVFQPLAFSQLHHSQLQRRQRHLASFNEIDHADSVNDDEPPNKVAAFDEKEAQFQQHQQLKYQLQQHAG